MPTETPTAETTVVDELPKELQLVVQQNQLQADTAKSLFASFGPLFSQARTVIENSRNVVVTDANQNLQIKLAKAYRLELKGIRVAGENARKEIKAETVRRAKAIDSFQHILEDLIVTEETRLEQQEKFAEVQEAKRKAALVELRGAVLTAVQIDPNLYALGEMSESTFQQLVEGMKWSRAAEAERRRKEEAEYIEREAKAEAERQRIRLENERMRNEADERQAAQNAERDRRRKEHAMRSAEMLHFVASGDESRNAQYGDLTVEEYAEVQAGAQNRREARLKAKAEREEAEKRYAEERRIAEEKAFAERKKLEAAQKAAAEKARKAEAELKAQRDAEAKRQADAAEAARKAAAAPDKDRLLNYANAVRALEIPTLSTPEANAIANLIKPSRDKFCDWIAEKSEAL